MITLGIDIGSRNTKLVCFDHSDRLIRFSGWTGTDVSPLDSVQRLKQRARKSSGISAQPPTAVTGYGRKLISPEARILSEIRCHAEGVRYYYPNARTIIDIGGQDAKVITLDAEGKIRDFAMNDKCAAGTGRFLEMTALRLGCPLSELSALAQKSAAARSISSTCVVFAESEIIGLIASGAASADIALAVHLSIAKRVVSQLCALEFRPPLVFTGGVAQNQDLVSRTSALLQEDISVPPDPEITAALGAALLAGL